MLKPRTAILGLGIMGSGMASRLLATGFPLVVYSRNAEKAARFPGAESAKSPGEAASRADIILSMVADDDASKAIWLGESGAIRGASSDSVLIESSTLTVKWTRELAGIATAAGRNFLDAPVTGTKPHAASGELLFLVGGSADALEKARPVLLALGRGVVHMGENGSGATLKLINNFLCGVQAASFAEALAMIAAAGLDADKALSVLMNGAPGSPLMKSVAARAAANRDEVSFALRLMAKDLKYAMDEAASEGLLLRTAGSALEIFQRAIAAGFGDEDFSAVVKSLKSA